MEIALDKIAILEARGPGPAPWNVWIPPRGPQDYEGGDSDGAIIGPYGDSFFQTFDAAVAFVRRVMDEQKAEALVGRREAGEACTQDESAWIKSFFDKYYGSTMSKRLATVCVSELGEWWDELERDLQRVTDNTLEVRWWLRATRKAVTSAFIEQRGWDEFLTWCEERQIDARSTFDITDEEWRKRNGPGMPRCPHCGASDRWRVDCDVTNRSAVLLSQPKVWVDRCGPEDTKVAQMGGVFCEGCGWCMDESNKDPILWDAIEQLVEGILGRHDVPWEVMLDYRQF